QRERRRILIGSWGRRPRGDRGRTGYRHRDASSPPKPRLADSLWWLGRRAPARSAWARGYTALSAPPPKRSCGRFFVGRPSNFALSDRAGAAPRLPTRFGRTARRFGRLD